MNRTKELIVFIILFLIIISPVSAKNKIPNYLKGIVFLESPKRKDDVLGVGFLCEIDGKKSVVSKLKSFVYDFPPIIKTIDGEILNFSKAKISEDKRNLIFFELKDDTSPDLIKLIPLESDVTGNVEMNGKLVLYGKKAKSKTIKCIKAKLIGVGITDMEIYASSKYHYSGGPVISTETGKCIACVVADKKKGNKYLTAIRFDNIKTFREINPTWVEEDIAKIKEKKNILEKIKEIGIKFSLLYNNLTSRVKQEHGTTNINIIKSRHLQTIRYIKSEIKKLKEPVEFHFPFYETTFPNLIEEADTILKGILELRFNKIQDEKSKSQEKSTKGNDIKRPKI